MLILKLTNPQGEAKYIAAAFPSACGKTNLAMLDPDDPRLEGRDHRRRHLLDEVRRRRPAVRHQPRGRLLRRRAGHGYDTNANAMETLWGNCIYTNTALTDDGDVWWEGMTDDAAGTGHRLEGQPWTPESDDPGRAPERPLHRPGRAVPVDRPRVGGPGRRADLGHPLRRPPPHDGAARDRGERLGARRVPRLDHGLGDHRRRSRAPSASCASTRWRCCRSAATTIADYFAHWLSMEQGHRPGQPAEDLLRQLVPPRRRRPLPVARLRREQPGAEVGVRAGRRHGRRRRHPDRQAADEGVARHRRSRGRRRRPGHDPVGRRRRLDGCHPADPGALRPLRRSPPRCPACRSRHPRSQARRPSDPIIPSAVSRRR